MAIVRSCSVTWPTFTCEHVCKIRRPVVRILVGSGTVLRHYNESTTIVDCDDRGHKVNTCINIRKDFFIFYVVMLHIFWTSAIDGGYFGVHALAALLARKKPCDIIWVGCSADPRDSEFGGEESNSCSYRN